MVRKIFLEDLPKKIYNNKEIVDWKNSIGLKVRFIYDDIEGKILIKDCFRENNRIKLLLTYKNREMLISSDNMYKCRLGTLLNKISHEFKVEVGQNFKDDKRDLIIIDREYRIDKNGHIKRKWYKHICNKCGWGEGWIEESSLLNGASCSCCYGRTVVRGINDIETNASWMVKYFVNIEDVYTYTKRSHNKVCVKCPDCGTEKYMRISDLNRGGFSCKICSDKISYPEKFLGNLLKQLNVNFKTQLSTTNYKWIINRIKYDFYFEHNNENYIIETHGLQHYKGGFERCGGRTLEEEQENDKNKKELALSSGIKEENYIVIDCRYSKIEWIKNNISHSKLSEIFDLSNIDWKCIDELCQKSLVKEVCEYWHLHNDIGMEELTTKNLEKVFDIGRSSITDCLKTGTKLGWCNYNPKEENRKNRIKIGKNNGKQVEIFKNGQSLGVFKSCLELERQSEELFRVNLGHQAISRVCRGIKSQYKGFTFKYVEDDERQSV